MVLPNRQDWYGCLNITDNIVIYLGCLGPALHGPPHAFIGGTHRFAYQSDDSPACAQW